MIRFHGPSIRLAMVLAIGVTVLAAPIASADESFIIPAGAGCAFDVLAEQTVGASGDRLPTGHGHANYTFTNVETDTSYLQRSRVSFTETFDPQTNTVLVEITGRYWANFYVGDQGPEGEVEYPGLLLNFRGDVQFTLDLETGFYTAFSYQGTYVDVCAEIAE